jgi:hypothetical protein
MSNKVLFQSKSGFNGFTFWLLMVVCAAALAFFIYRFNESPGLATGVIVFFVLLILLNSRDNIAVKEDHFEIINKRLLPVLSNTRKYTFDEIAEIEADLPLTRMRGIESVLFYRPMRRTVMNTIVITYKDGKKKTISPTIYRNDLQEAFKYIQHQSHIEIRVTGIK